MRPDGSRFPPSARLLTPGPTVTVTVTIRSDTGCDWPRPGPVPGPGGPSCQSMILPHRTAALPTVTWVRSEPRRPRRLGLAAGPGPARDSDSESLSWWRAASHRAGARARRPEFAPKPRASHLSQRLSSESRARQPHSTELPVRRSGSPQRLPSPSAFKLAGRSPISRSGSRSRSRGGGRS